MILLMFLVVTPLWADNDETVAYQNESLTLVPLDETTRESYARTLLYQNKKKPVKIKRNQINRRLQRPTVDPASFDDVLRYLLVFVAIIIMCYVLFRYMAGDAALFKQSVKRQKSLGLTDIETNLEAVDVDYFLKKSLEDKAYRLSIRLYYLAIIKKLSERRAIRWTKDKTNGHYVRELRSDQHPAYAEFKNLTRLFEYVWYSDVRFDQGQFKEVSVDFQNFLQKINKK